MKLIIHRSERDTNFGTISLICNNDPNVSGLAKSIHTYMVTRPDEWELRTGHIYKCFKEKRDAITNAIRELEDNGYIKRTEERPERGRFASVTYDVYEKPIPKQERARLQRRRGIKRSINR
jgi:hypothetical protein